MHLIRGKSGHGYAEEESNGMRTHLPKAGLIAVLGCLTLAGCVDGVQVEEHTYKGTLTCPNLDPMAQKYMHGTPSAPVRCGPQKVNYWDPTVTTTSGHSKPAG